MNQNEKTIIQLHAKAMDKPELIASIKLRMKYIQLEMSLVEYCVDNKENDKSKQSEVLTSFAHDLELLGIFAEALVKQIVVERPKSLDSLTSTLDGMELEHDVDKLPHEFPVGESGCEPGTPLFS